MSDVIALSGSPGELVDPLIREARARQRRRRLVVAEIVATAVAVSAVLIMTSREWGVPIAGWHTTNADIIRREVRATVTRFDIALADGHYARACGLLDPVQGQGVLRRATTAVGISGNCEARLGAVARLVGRKRLNELKTARIYNVNYAGSLHQFAAGLEFNQEDISWAGYIPSVGVGRNGPGQPVLIGCAPLICGGPHVLQNYIDINKALKPR